MSDLAAALREAGHPEVASELERRELAGRLPMPDAMTWRMRS
jgi:hypothetical protein